MSTYQQPEFLNSQWNQCYLMKARIVKKSNGINAKLFPELLPEKTFNKNCHEWQIINTLLWDSFIILKLVPAPFLLLLANFGQNFLNNFPPNCFFLDLHWVFGPEFRPPGNTEGFVGPGDTANHFSSPVPLSQSTLAPCYFWWIVSPSPPLQQERTVYVHM